MNPIDVFARIYDLPPMVRNRLMSAGIPRVIPLTGGLKIRVDDVDDHRSTTSMPFTRRSQNHVGSMYLGALYTQAEITMATLVVGRCRPPTFRVLVKKSESEFHARADGVVRATCEPLDDERANLDRCCALVEKGAKDEAWITVRTTAKDATPICTNRFLISVKRAR